MKKFLIGLLVVLVLVVVGLNYYLGNIVKAAAERLGPSVLGVPVKLSDADFQLLRGHIQLRGFVLGNPAGFKTDKAIGVGNIVVDLQPSSLFGDTITIDRIHVNAPEINYEIGLTGSNIGAILDGMDNGKEEGTSDEKPKEGKKAGKKVLIHDFLIENGKITIAAKVPGGLGAPVPLPTIHLTELGKDEGGSSPVEIASKVFGAILSTVTGVVTGAGKLAVEGVEAVGSAATEGVKQVGSAAADGAKKVGEAIGGLFGGKGEESKESEK